MVGSGIAPQSRRVMRVMRVGVQTITGCLIHIVTRYRDYNNISQLLFCAINLAIVAIQRRITEITNIKTFKIET